MSRTHQSLIDIFDALPEGEQAVLLEDLKRRVNAQGKKGAGEFLPIGKGTVNSDAQDRVTKLRR